MFAETIEDQRRFFRSGETLGLKFRLGKLKKLYKAIEIHEDEILEAVYRDFHKSAFEVFGTEIAQVKEEIKYFLKNLPKLMRPERVKSSLASFPAKSFIYKEPYGISLIIGPWNYPFMLTVGPFGRRNSSRQLRDSQTI